MDSINRLWWCVMAKISAHPKVEDKSKKVISPISSLREYEK
jgi:hypothetical protein